MAGVGACGSMQLQLVSLSCHAPAQTHKDLWPLLLLKEAQRPQQEATLFLGRQPALRLRRLASAVVRRKN